MKNLGDFTEDATLDFKFNTHVADGTPITLAGTPVVSVYKANGTTETTSGVTLTTDFDSRTGTHHVRVDLSADAFYATGSDYQVVITTGTVDSVSVVGTVVAEFSIENRSSSADAAALLVYGDNNWTTATGFSTHAAADVWSVGTRALTATGHAGIADAVWDEEIQGDHEGPNSAGEHIIAAADVSSDAIADAVWDEAQSEHVVSGSFGSYLDQSVSAAGGAASSPQLLVSTTIATLASQQSFVLTAGSSDDDAYRGALVVVTDSATNTQKAISRVVAYAGSTRMVTLVNDPGIFTMGVGDMVVLIATDTTVAVGNPGGVGWLG